MQGESHRMIVRFFVLERMAQRNDYIICKLVFAPGFPYIDACFPDRNLAQLFLLQESKKRKFSQFKVVKVELK